jgi:FG-GAP-like repeat
MERSRCRNLLFLVIVASTMAGLGDGLSAVANPPAPSTSVRRITSLRGQVIAADFNGDGIIDLASTSATPAFGAKPIVVALGKGDGTFNAPTSSGTNGGVLAAGDFNKDGKLDLIANVNDATDMPVRILLGKGDGTFSAPIQIGSAVGLAITFGIAADFDGDGHLDVGIGFIDDEGDDDSVVIYQGHGDGTFSDVVARLHTGTASFPAGAVTADLNDDGKPDVVVANHWGKSLSIFVNHGSFMFTASERPLGRGANDVTAVDLNGDGKLDLIVADSLSQDVTDPNFEDGSIDVLMGKGDGTFGVGESYSTGFGAWRVVTGDFNRDGILDVATANQSALAVRDCGPLYKTWDSISILTGVGDGTFSGGSDFSIGNQHNIDDPRYRHAATSLAAVDVNGDHALDLVVSDGVIFTNKAPDANWAPTVTAGSTTPAADHSVTLRAVADDVDQDVLVYSWTDSGGSSIPPVPNPCIKPSTLGVHTFTVTVDDTHGHRASSSVTVDFGSGGASEDHTIHISAPVAGEVVTGAQPYTIRWTASATMAHEEVFILLSINDGPSTHIWECDYTQVSTGQCVWQNPGPATDKASISIVTRDADFPGSGGTGPFSIHYPAGEPPYPWRHGDVGAVAAAGSTSYQGGVFTVRGSGADIWGTADEFQYAYQFFPGCGTGDVDLVTRVDSVQNVNAWTKAGLMLRSSLSPGAAHASLLVTPGKGIAFQRRTALNGSSVNTGGPLTTAPVWLRLSVRGTIVTAYYRTSPSTAWIKIGEQTYPTGICGGGFGYAGLALSSHVDGTVATARFSNVVVSHPPDWSANTIGPYAGTATFDGTTATIQGRGTDIWNAADQFTFFSDTCFGDCTITARVRSLQNTNAWAKAGVMFRETLSGPSRHVDMIVSPSKGAAMQYRAATGGASAQAGATAGAAPGWVQLTRAGNVFTGYWSADGVTFTPVGTATVAMSYGVSVGLAVTSHDTTAAATGVFDNISIQQP